MVSVRLHDTRALVEEHIAAFNAHDTGRLLAGLHEGVVWATGTDTFRGHEELLGVFDQGLWDLDPHLDVRRVVVDGDVAALECAEALTLGAERVTFPIVVFLAVRDGLIASVRVYREGSADLPA